MTTQQARDAERSRIVAYIRNIADTFHPNHDRVIERIAADIERRDDDNYPGIREAKP